MRMLRVLAGVAGVLVGVLLAQSDSDYQDWMKVVGPSNSSLLKNIATKDAAGVAAEAKKLQDTFKQVGEFWQKRNATDAVNFAKQAQTAAAAIVQDAAAGNMAQAGNDSKDLAATCGGCHMAHRAKGDSGFKIK
jgi:cytochrome c556